MRFRVTIPDGNVRKMDCEVAGIARLVVAVKNKFALAEKFNIWTQNSAISLR